MMQIIINIISSFSIYLLVSVSFSIIYYSTRFFHLAHAATISLGAYLTFFFAKQLSFPFIISLIIAIVIATSIGVLCEMFFYSSMRKKNVPPLSYLIASIGIYVVLQNIISLCFGDNVQVLRIGEITTGHQFLGAYITTIQITTISISIALFIVINLFSTYSSTGKSMRAVANNPELSNIYGINSNKIILIAFSIGSALAALTGILSAMDTNMTPTFGFNLLLYGVVAMIIGGVGSTSGLIAGALLIATVQHIAGYLLTNNWMSAITYVILILFLIWKPLGFSGNRLRKVEI